MKKPYRILLGVVVVGFGLLAAVMASTEVRKSERAARHLPSGTAGMVATINPETGLLGGAPEVTALSAAELNALSTETEDLVEVHHPNGAVSIDLEGRFQSSTMVTLDAQGRPQIHCVNTPAAAAAILNQPVSTTSVSTTPALEEK